MALERLAVKLLRCRDLFIGKWYHAVMITQSKTIKHMQAWNQVMIV